MVGLLASRRGGDHWLLTNGACDVPILLVTSWWRSVPCHHVPDCFTHTIVRTLHAPDSGGVRLWCIFHASGGAIGCVTLTAAARARRVTPKAEQRVDDSNAGTAVARLSTAPIVTIGDVGARITNDVLVFLKEGAHSL